MDKCRKNQKRKNEKQKKVKCRNSEKKQIRK